MIEETPEHFGYESLGRFLENQTTDQLFHILFQLAAEVWTVKRRLRESEELLVANGIIASLDSMPREASFEFDPAERDLFIERIFGTLRETSTVAKG
jgi:hypothetical protein